MNKAAKIYLALLALFNLAVFGWALSIQNELESRIQRDTEIAGGKITEQDMIKAQMSALSISIGEIAHLRNRIESLEKGQLKASASAKN